MEQKQKEQDQRTQSAPANDPSPAELDPLNVEITPNHPQPLTSPDESTTNGLTTAPATSEEDDDSDEDDDDSRSYYSFNNDSSNMSVMVSGPGRGRRHYGGRLSSGSSQVKGEEKRSHHNVLERKRRDLLKDSFTRLRDSVPTTQPKERVSRAEILRQAADFIATTVKKNVAASVELNELIRKNRELEEKRKQQGAGGVVGDGVATGTPSGSAPILGKVETETIKQES